MNAAPLAAGGASTSYDSMLEPNLLVLIALEGLAHVGVEALLTRARACRRARSRCERLDEMLRTSASRSAASPPSRARVVDADVGFIPLALAL